MTTYTDPELDVLMRTLKVINWKFYKSKASAAKKLHEVLRDVARDFGQNPDIEVAIWTPEQSREAGTGDNWRVIWEAGPYNWAITASLTNLFGDNWFTEPYYGFDLCFTY